MAEVAVRSKGVVGSVVIDSLFYVPHIICRGSVLIYYVASFLVLDLS